MRKILKTLLINCFVFLGVVILLDLIFGNWFKNDNFGYSIRELRNVNIPMSVKYDGQIYDISFDSFELNNATEQVIRFERDSKTPIPPYLQLPGFFNYMFDNFKRDGKNPLQGTKLEIKCQM